MPEYADIEQLKNVLRQRPDQGLMTPSGSAVILLAPGDHVIIVEAAEGGSFLSMTDEEVNEAVVNALK